MNPTLAAAIGPLKGTSAIDIAADAAINATTSGGFSLSSERSMQFTCTSSLKKSGKSGLNGLSINLDVKVSISVGLPSLLK